MIKTINHFFYSIAKIWIGGTLLHWIFAYFSFAIPGEKLIETDILLTFLHPSPSYPLHILIVPKARQRSLLELPSDVSIFESALFEAVKELVLRFGLEAVGYRLIVNGENAQEVDQLHFHLVSDDYVSGSSEHA